MAEEMIGLCGVCGIAQYNTEHDHRPIGTLTPEQAEAHWRRRAGDAPKSW